MVKEVKVPVVKVTWYAYWWALRTDLQNYHPLTEEGNGKPLHSPALSGSLLNDF